MTRALLMIGSWSCLALSATGQEYSALWGRNGEKWDPAGRLPDISYAGYACGDRPIPKIPVTANVRDFGAKGDGTTDASDAFLTAIAKTERGAIAVPAGRYRISKIIEITKPGIVLRGAGPERSILVCPVPLNDIKPNWGATTSGQRTSNYSWSGGLVWFKGGNPGKSIGKVTAAAKRGSHELRIDGKTSSIQPGAWIEINMRDDADKSLLEHLYSDDPGNLGKIKPSSHKTSFASRIRKVAEGMLTLERPLRTDVRPEWNAEVSIYQPAVTECGIENLGFEFPERKYGGHFSELGFNAVAFSGVAHCWARNLLVTNSDSGVFAGGRFCTIDGLRCQMRDVKENKGVFGHHGVTLSGHDNLLTRFEIDQRYIHDLSVEGGAGNVFSSGSGSDLCFDHHKRAPYENVFTDIDLGAGTRMWKCGGGADLGRQSGARGTFWNIRAKQAQKYPNGFGPPSMNLVGVQTKDESLTEPNGRWFEAIPPKKIQPANLHQAQWMKRMGAK
jgi:hypothetical protein